jgi:hypothetical protein
MPMASMLMANRKARPNEGKGLQRMFAPRHLTLDIFFPTEAFQAIEAPALRIDYKQRSTLFNENFRSIALSMIGANHIILNFKYGAGNATEVLDEIGEEILPPLVTNSQNATP